VATTSLRRVVDYRAWMPVLALEDVELG